MYLYIARKMHYSVLADQLTPLIAQAIAIDKTIPNKTLYERVGGRYAFIFGGGSSLLKDIHQFKRRIYNRYRDKIVVISADVATHPLIYNGVIPDIVITDLDGDIASLIYSSMKGSLIVVHGHGDNLPQIIHYIRLFRNIVVSTQVVPLPPIINYGGYTDGDRAVLLADRCGSPKIFLVAMDFRGEVDKYRKIRKLPTRIKRMKLIIGREIIRMYGGSRRIFFTGYGSYDSNDFGHIGWEDVENLINPQPAQHL